MHLGRSAGVDGCSAEVHTAGHDLLHRTVAGIGDEDVAVRVHGNAPGLAEAAAERVDGSVTARLKNLLHRIVQGVGDEDVADGVQCNACGGTEAEAAQGVDRAVGCEDLLHGIVAAVGDEDVSAGVYCYARGVGEAAAQRSDGAADENLLHRAVAGVGDENVAAGVYCYRGGTGEAAAEGAHGGVTAGRENLLHGSAGAIGDEDVAAGIHCDGLGGGEAASQGVDIAQLKCAACASAEGANTPSALRHRAARASTPLPQRTLLVLPGRPLEAAIRLPREVLCEVAQDETREGPAADEKSISWNLLMEKAYNETKWELDSHPAGARRNWTCMMTTNEPKAERLTERACGGTTLEKLPRHMRISIGCA